jgi:hypothetical protein
VSTCWSESQPGTTAACPLVRAASLAQLLAGGYLVDTGSAVQPVAGQRPADEVLSLARVESLTRQVSEHVPGLTAASYVARLAAPPYRLATSATISVCPSDHRTSVRPRQHPVRAE